MAGLYALRLTNNSPLGGNMCLYQHHPDQEAASDLYSLAWQCQNCPPGATTTFSWALDFGFAWAAAGSLGPGAFFEPIQAIEADPGVSGKRSVLFHNSAHGYELGPGSPEPEAGYLNLQTDDSVPQNQMAVALTVSGRPAFARPAGPNLDLTFRPELRYWVAFGPFEAGQALDFDEIMLTTEVVFPAGKRSAQAAFQRDCTWAVR